MSNKFSIKEEKETLERFINALHGHNGFLSLKVMKKLTSILDHCIKSGAPFPGLCSVKKIYWEKSKIKPSSSEESSAVSSLPESPQQ